MDSKSFRFISHQLFFSTLGSGDLDVVKQAVDVYHEKLAEAELSSFLPAASDRARTMSSLMRLQNDEGKTALFVAAENDFRDVFAYLVEFCELEDVLIRSKSDLNAFHVAASLGHLGIVEELLNRWPELCRSCDKSNTSPIYSAAVKDNLDVVNLILDVDASAARIVRKNGKTALHTAGRYGFLRIVKALIDRDPGIVSIKDKKGQTALHMAVKGQSSAVVEEILLGDPSVLNERDKKGNTAVHIATRKCRSQIVSLLLSFSSINVNAINTEQQTAMDIAEKLTYGDSTFEIKEALVEAGAKHARHVGQVDMAMELKRTVSDIRHEIHSQLIQNEQTHKRVTGVAKELRKLHREAVQNTTNSVTVVAVLFASIAFLAIFNLPGQYLTDGSANIAESLGFKVFFLLNTTSLFISLAVVVVQITLVAWDTKAQQQVVSVVNKLMWAACISTCAAFLSIAFVVVGKGSSWTAITITVMGAPILVCTLASMCFFVFKQHFSNDSSQRRIKRASGSKSFSWPDYSANISDPDEYNSDHQKMYAL